MARNRILDFMQSHRFWLFDLVPSAAPPFFVLGAPFLGFASISAPEYNADIDTIEEGNSMFKRYAYMGGSTSEITMSRGVKGFDDSMWQWMHRAIKGIDETNRHLLLIQFTSINVGFMDTAMDALTGAWSYGIIPKLDLDTSGLPSEIASFVPGKAWLLWDCIPTKYRSGSGFDGKSGEVSVAELTVQPYAISEFTLLDPL